MAGAAGASDPSSSTHEKIESRYEHVRSYCLMCFPNPGSKRTYDVTIPETAVVAAGGKPIIREQYFPSSVMSISMPLAIGIADAVRTHEWDKLLAKVPDDDDAVIYDVFHIASIFQIPLFSAAFIARFGPRRAFNIPDRTFSLVHGDVTISGGTLDGSEYFLDLLSRDWDMHERVKWLVKCRYPADLARCRAPKRTSAQRAPSEGLPESSLNQWQLLIWIFQVVCALLLLERALASA